MSAVTVIERCDSSNKSTFQAAYATLCKEKNVPAILEVVRNKNKLDLIVDKIKPNQWSLILKSLDRDNTLESIVVRSRKPISFVDDKIDANKKSSRCETPSLSSKYIIQSLIESLSECVKRNSVITSLILEGLPLTTDYVQMITDAISRNNSLKIISFARSPIKDEGCDIICAAIKNLSHIEKINFSQCQLTVTAAIHIAELIKFQTMNRCSEGWMASLRYRDVDIDTIPGLKCLVLNENAFGDEGMELITKYVREDIWIKAIEVQNCEITNKGGEAILDCLNFNKSLVVFDVNHNHKISSNLLKRIQMMLGTEPDDYDTRHKPTNSELRDKIEFLEQRLQLEIFNRKHADALNVELNKNLIQFGDRTLGQNPEQNLVVPIGFKLVNEDLLEAIRKEIDELLQERGFYNQKNTEQSGLGDIAPFPPNTAEQNFVNSEPEKEETFCQPKLIWNKPKTDQRSNVTSGLDLLNQQIRGEINKTDVTRMRST